MVKKWRATRHRPPNHLPDHPLADGRSERITLPTRSALARPLRRPNGDPIAINGLWGLRFGNGEARGPNALLGVAGIHDDGDGSLEMPGNDLLRLP